MAPRVVAEVRLAFAAHTLADCRCRRAGAGCRRRRIRELVRESHPCDSRSGHRAERCRAGCAAASGRARGQLGRLPGQKVTSGSPKKSEMKLTKKKPKNTTLTSSSTVCHHFGRAVLGSLLFR
jgi:hypothetical protein